MMNMLKVQDQLKNFSEEQLVQSMQSPSEQAPQFLVLGEINRRQKMRQEAQRQEGLNQTTVAQDAISAAGVPQGGLSDMSRALAPNTDVVNNTGIMSLAPQGEPQRMAGGGPVRKMAEGKRVPASLMNDAAFIAMASREGMTAQEYFDTLDPKTQENQIRRVQERAARDRFTAMEPIGDSTMMPTQSDLDRRFQEEQLAFGASRPMVAPAALDPNTGAPAQVGRVIPRTSEIENALQAPFMGGAPVADALPSSPRLSPEQLAAMAAAQPSVAPGIIESLDPDTQARLDQTARTMAALRAERAQGPGPSFEEVGREVGAASILDMANTYAPPRPPIAPVPVPVTDGAENYDFTGGQDTPLPGALERIFGAPALERVGIPTVATPALPGQTTGAPLEVPEGGIKDLLPPEAQAQIAAEEAVKNMPAAQPNGGGGGGGGGGGAGGMSSYEQELMDTLKRREAARDQDKWLALAEIGLGMMSSQSSNIAGAFGEAGLKGIESLRSSRDQYDKDRLELLGAVEQSRMARARAASGGGGRALPVGALDVYDAEIEALNAALSDPLNPPSPDQKMRLKEQRDALLTDKATLRNAYLGQYGLTAGGASPAATSGVYSMDDVS